MSGASILRFGNHNFLYFRSQETEKIELFPKGLTTLKIPEINLLLNLITNIRVPTQLENLENLENEKKFPSLEKSWEKGKNRKMSWKSSGNF